METKIYLPNDAQRREMMANAYKELCKMAKEAGYDFYDEKKFGNLKDMFMAGYSFGWNDCLSIFRGQIEATTISSEPKETN